MAICPASTPRLNPTKANASTPRGSPRSVSTLAKPKPWISPKEKATTQRFPWTIGNRLLSAASSTDMGDGGFRKACRQAHDLQGGEGQRERVRHCESGDNLKHVDQGGAESLAWHPPLLATHHHCRQQQR